MFESNRNSYYKLAPKTTCLLLAQLIECLIEYTSELTYFSIHAFQISSLKRVQTSTLTRLDNYSIPNLCAFRYSLEREFEEFVQRMKKLCKRTQSTFLDLRSARIHYPKSSMDNIPSTHRSLNVLKCNIERLRDLKEIHHDVGYDLLVPNDQLFVSLDLLVTNFQLILCELDNRVRFKDAIILQTLVKDIFLQFRVVLTWLYPPIKMTASRTEDSNKKLNKISESNKKPMPTTKITQDRSQSALPDDRSIDSTKQNNISDSDSYSSFIKRPSISNKNKETNEHDLNFNHDIIWSKDSFQIDSVS